MRCQRFRRYWLLLGFSFWLLSPAASQDIPFPAPDIAESLEVIKNSSLKIKEESQILKAKIASLQIDNERLDQSLRDQQEISQQQDNQLTQLSDSLTEYSRQLSDSQRRIKFLERWNRVWKFVAGILAATTIGAVM